MTLADITERLMAEFEARHSLIDIVAVVAGCRRDLQGSPASAQPELVERLARQRLLDRRVVLPLVPAPRPPVRLHLT